MPDYLSEPDPAFLAAGLTESVRKAEFIKAKARLESAYPQEAEHQTSCASRLFSQMVVPTQMANAYPVLPFKPSLLLESRSILPDPRWSYLKPLTSETRAKIDKQWHPLHLAQYIFTKAHLENLILSNLGDRGEMAHSIEGRTPFLDHRLTEYANSLPPNMKIRPRIEHLRSVPRSSNDLQKENSNSRISESNVEYVEKYVLREAARPFITDKIYRKRKHPYSAPLQYGVDGPLHRLMRRLVTEDNIAALGFLEWAPDLRDVASRGRRRTLGEMVDLAFGEKDESTFRLVICLAQWVVLGKQFGVRTVEV